MVEKLEMQDLYKFYLKQKYPNDYVLLILPRTFETEILFSAVDGKEGKEYDAIRELLEYCKTKDIIGIEGQKDILDFIRWDLIIVKVEEDEYRKISYKLATDWHQKYITGYIALYKGDQFYDENT
ncbi:MAG: hypothetical protein ACO2O4_03775 [Minisyncoccia bacterium]|jgi:hypothetical protein